MTLRPPSLFQKYRGGVEAEPPLGRSPTAPGVTVRGRADIEGRPLFADLILPIAPAAWTCLLGGSGVGKSTILRLIADLEVGADFTGEITASDGAPVAPRVGYMAQDDLCLPWASVRDNITLGARLRRHTVDAPRADQLIADVGLTDHAHKKPGALSGGQRQRVALARTLMEDKPVILLDEPFSALDAKTRSEMQDLAARLLAGRTVLLVTHDPGEAARLGHAIHVLSADGLSAVSVPKTRAPRAVDDAEMLTTQGALLARLRAA